MVAVAEVRSPRLRALKPFHQELKIYWHKPPTGDVRLSHSFQLDHERMPYGRTLDSITILKTEDLDPRNIVIEFFPAVPGGPGVSSWELYQLSDEDRYGVLAMNAGTWCLKLPIKSDLTDADGDPINAIVIDLDECHWKEWGDHGEGYYHYWTNPNVALGIDSEGNKYLVVRINGDNDDEFVVINKDRELVKANRVIEVSLN